MHIRTDRASYDVATPDCLVCNTKNDFVHAYLVCPALRLVWEHSWPILRLLCEQIPSWSNIRVNEVELLLGFLNLEGSLADCAAQFRLRTFFVLVVEQIQECFRTVQGLCDTDAPTKAWERLTPRWAKVPTNVVRRVLQLATGQRQGPDAVPKEVFAERWAQHNRLFSEKGDTMTLESTRPSTSEPLLTALNSHLLAAAPDSAARATANTAAEPLAQLAPAASGNGAQPRHELYSDAPPSNPQWAETNDRKQCGCCKHKRRCEVHTLLCIPCWKVKFPSVDPPDNIGPFSYTHMTCRCSRAIRDLPGSVQRWADTGQLLRCVCCHKKSRIELFRSRCARCWPKLFPNDPIQLDPRSLRYILNAKTSRNKKCSCYD